MIYRFILAIFIFLYSFNSFADSTLSCKVSDYRGARHGHVEYNKGWAMSWVPENFVIILDDNNQMRSFINRFSIKRQKLQNNQIDFLIETGQIRTRYSGILNLKDYKFKVKIDFQDYVDSGYIRGDCKKNTSFNSTNDNNTLNRDADNFSAWSDEQLCKFAVYDNGEWASNALIVSEAKRRGLTCRENKSTAPQVSSNATLTSEQTQSSTSSQVTSNQSSSSSVGVFTDNNQTTVVLSKSYSQWNQAQSPEEAQAFANEIQASILMYTAIYEVIEQQPPTLKDRVLSVVDNEIIRLRAEKELLQKELSSRFSTPIRPNNANLSVSSFRAADTFPKIPFYIPGTNEIGEMLVIPRVTDLGFLEYQFDFLDPTATYDKVRDTVSIPHENIDDVIAGLHKIDEWTQVAQENNVNRRIEKTSACIPKDACEIKKQGVSSSEIIFQIYEDGSTAGRIQRNKGMFSVGYNMSVESSILLSAYLTYMQDTGAKEFNIGIMSDEEVIKLFE